MEISSKKRTNSDHSVDISSMVFGKVPPHAIEVENAILGAILVENNRAFDIVSEILNAECFYLESHQVIFTAMRELSVKGSFIEIISVVEYLKKSNQLETVGGPYYLTKLATGVVTTAGLEQNCRIILEKFMKRELIKIAGQMISSGYDESTDIFDFIDETERDIYAVSNSFLKKDFQTLQNLGVEVLNKIDQLRASTESLSGVTSGFRDIDRITHGWQPTDLIILAARPSVGKTAFALNLARNACNRSIPVGFFSLEMSASQLTQRILSAETEVPMESIKTGRMQEYEYTVLLTKGLHKIERLNMFIDDSAALNIFEFRAKARRMVSKHGVGLIIIDYLQLMSGMRDRNGNREQEISTISRNLKALAKELNVPIIALSQLSRAVETRSTNKVPQLSDLRESGAIEQDADMVMFIYRPEYHNIQSNEHGESTHNLTEIKIAKHRNGSLDTIKLRSELAIQKFFDYEGTNTGSWVPVKKESDFFDGFND